MRIAGRDWKSGSIRTGREFLPSPVVGEGDPSEVSSAGERSLFAKLDGMPAPVGSQLRSHATTLSLRGECGRNRIYHAPSQRSHPPLLHPGRSRLRFPDPESPLWRVLGQGRPGAARRRCDRRLCARSLGARAGLPAAMSATLGVFCGADAQSLHGAGAESCGRATRARISELLRHDNPELRDNPELARARAGADGAGKAAYADRGRRLHRFLFVEGARHQCRRHVPRQGQRAAAELAAYADRLQRPRLDRRGVRHQSAAAARATKAAERGRAELRPLQAARFRTRNGRRGRAGARRWARCSPKRRRRR